MTTPPVPQRKYLSGHIQASVLHLPPESARIE
jgi:hypothetical protein